MVVRCVRSLLLVVSLIFGGTAWVFFTKAGDPSIYAHHYVGVGAVVGILIVATRGFEIFGLNPVMLSLGISMLAVTTSAVRKIVTGESARVEQDAVQIPSWFGWSGTKSVALADIVSAERKAVFWGWAFTITIVTINRRRAVIAASVGADAAEFVEMISLTPPASPANPPAT